MHSSYLVGLPRKFVRAMAGFPQQGGAYFIPRAAHTPPLDLQSQIWPWVEEWEERFRKRNVEGKSWAKGGINQGDNAAEGFLALLKHLRVVLLQDLAVLQLGK